MNAVATCLAAAKTYAAFVWPAFGIAVLVLGGIALQSWRRYRTSVRALDRLELQHTARR
jgi:heme exporter protein CcmD